MAVELGQAYVHIIPSAKGISGAISQQLGGEATSAGKSAGLNIAGAIKGAIAAAGIGTAIKAALDAGGDLQQSYGGLETLYGDAADQAKEYAAAAAEAGISANNYAEQAVSFGASLKQAFGGDTIKAAEAANTAILDMADNSAKMGTDIESIQNAYQGFAKQNYTMLDNLKLGYGGTKTEMERLLADAQKLSGVEYNIDNLGDVYSAIHVIQEDLGLTGVAADEASTTFTGSFNAMKASAENLLANLALGEDIGPALTQLGTSVQAFVLNNLLPMLLNIVTHIPDLIVGIVQALIAAAPQLLSAAQTLAQTLVDGMTTGFDWLTGSTQTIQGFLDGITANFPAVMEQGVQTINNMVNGILSNLPALISTAGELITMFVSFLMENYPTILQGGVDMILNLVNGIISNLPAIVASVLQIILKFITTIATHLPEIIQQGIVIMAQLVAGLIRAIPQLIMAVGTIIKNFVQQFKSYNWAEIGLNILIGIKNGILNAIGVVIDAAKEAGQAIWDTITGFFSIESPSKLMAYAGEMIDAGLAKGITDNEGLVDNAISRLNTNAMSDFSVTGKYDFTSNSNDKIGTLVSLLSDYLPQIAQGDNVTITLDGDAGRLFRMMQAESIRNKQITGQNAFA